MGEHETEDIVVNKGGSSKGMDVSVTEGFKAKVSNIYEESVFFPIVLKLSDSCKVPENIRGIFAFTGARLGGDYIDVFGLVFE